MLCRSFAIHGSRVSKSEPLEPSSPLRVCVKRDLRLAMGNGVMFENVVNLGKSSLVAVSSSGMQWNLGGEKKVNFVAFVNKLHFKLHICMKNMREV